MKKMIPRYIIIKLVKTNDKKKNLISNQRKECKLHVNRNKDKDDRRLWKQHKREKSEATIFKRQKKITVNLNIYTQKKYILQKTKQNKKQSSSLLQEMLKEVFQAERK